MERSETITTTSAVAGETGGHEAPQDTRADIRQNTRKVFVKTYGCQMNVYDSERMEDALTQGGYVRTERMEDADLVLLNTCHIREKAAEKVYSEIGRIR
ncbi:MAG: hypothetical protein KDJ64_10410, partial [Nitratireductor sp.]|nr:hypothetical protein [Nitratireductor sp.]